MADHKIDGNDGAGNAGIDGLRLVKFENGQFDFRGGPVQYIAEYFAQMMDAGEGKYFNNMEIAFSHHDAGEMVLSVQRKSGKTPIQQRKEAEAERDAANARADQARDAALVEAKAAVWLVRVPVGSTGPIWDAMDAIEALRDKPAALPLLPDMVDAATAAGVVVWWDNEAQEVKMAVTVHEAARVLLGVFEDPDANAPHGFDWQSMYDEMTADHKESLDICGTHDWPSTLIVALRAIAASEA